jgi:predicted metalloprotease
MFLGIDPSIILNQSLVVTEPESSSVQKRSPAEDQAAQFVSTVLADTEDTWPEVFRENGATYVNPKLVLFTGSVESACGYAKAAMGPFYCPRDQKVYIDLSFFRDLKARHNAPGDFAQAYVIAHEVGHHAQNLLGILPQAQKAQSQMSKAESNRVSVMVELQADCFAGVWAHRAQKSRQILEEGDLEEALNAASQIGDDRLQSQAQGYVVPDSFTHGSSAQRVRWFKQGLKTGDINQCNTFNAKNL